MTTFLLFIIALPILITLAFYTLMLAVWILAMILTGFGHILMFFGYKPTAE